MNDDKELRRANRNAMNVLDSRFQLDDEPEEITVKCDRCEDKKKLRCTLCHGDYAMCGHCDYYGWFDCPNCSS